MKNNHNILFLLLVILQIPVLLPMFGLYVPYPSFIAFLITFLFFLIFKYRFPIKSFLDLLVLIIVIYLFFSILLLFKPNSSLPGSIAFIGIVICIFPISFYYIGSSLRAKQFYLFLRKFLLLHFGIFIFFIFLHYVFIPDFYIEYLRNVFVNVGYLQNERLLYRLQGYLGSTSIGVLSVNCLLLCQYLDSKKLITHLFIGVFFLTAMLSWQRSAMILSIFSLIIFYISNFNMKTFLISGLLLIFVSVILSFNNNAFDIYKILEDRIINDISINSFYERVSYFKYIQAWEHYLFGIGLGATTSHADRIGLNPGGEMIDANFIRIAADSGFVVLFLYLMIPIYSLKFIKDNKVRPLVYIILQFNFQALVTNVFDSYYTGYLYWLYLGILYNLRAYNHKLIFQNK